MVQIVSTADIVLVRHTSVGYSRLQGPQCLLQRWPNSCPPFTRDNLCDRTGNNRTSSKDAAAELVGKQLRRTQYMAHDSATLWLGEVAMELTACLKRRWSVDAYLCSAFICDEVLTELCA